MEQNFVMDGCAFSVRHEDGVQVEVFKKNEQDGVSLYGVRFDWGKLTIPTPITLSWELAAMDFYYMWDPINPQRNLSFSNRTTDSRMPCGMPLKSLVSRGGKNAYLVAVSDVKT